MRVVTWNMNGWQEGWAFVARQIKPDIALLTEAPQPPADYPALFSKDPESKNKGTGTAIYSKNGRPQALQSVKAGTKDFRLSPTHEGCLLVGEVPISARQSLLAICLYGRLYCDYADVTLHRSISDITGVFWDKKNLNRCILGGDFNLSSQRIYKNPEWNDYVSVDELVLERLKRLGLKDLSEATADQRGPLPDCCGERCHHIRTFRSRNPKVNGPWQRDHLFAGPRLAESIQERRAEPGDDHSDHFPLVAVFHR